MLLVQRGHPRRDGRRRSYDSCPAGGRSFGTASPSSKAASSADRASASTYCRSSISASPRLDVSALTSSSCVRQPRPDMDGLSYDPHRVTHIAPHVCRRCPFARLVPSTRRNSWPLTTGHERRSTSPAENFESVEILPAVRLPYVRCIVLREQKLARKFQTGGTT